MRWTRLTDQSKRELTARAVLSLELCLRVNDALKGLVTAIWSFWTHQNEAGGSSTEAVKMPPETSNGRLTSEQRRLLGKVFDCCEDIRELYQAVTGQEQEVVAFEELAKAEVAKFAEHFRHLAIAREKAVDSHVPDQNIVYLMADRLPQPVFNHLLAAR